MRYQVRTPSSPESNFFSPARTAGTSTLSADVWPASTSKGSRSELSCAGGCRNRSSTSLFPPLAATACTSPSPRTYGEVIIVTTTFGTRLSSLLARVESPSLLRGQGGAVAARDALGVALDDGVEHCVLRRGPPGPGVLAELIHAVPDVEVLVL